MEVKVAIMMGSDSDFPIMESALNALDSFEIGYDVIVTSAHRTPARTVQFIENAEHKGIQIFIVGAGAAAHLAGVVAAHTTLPVIGVPIDSSALAGLDALYATVMMPGGIPVASMAIGKAGAKNAGLFAVSILSTADGVLRAKLKAYRQEMVKTVEAKSEALQQRIKARQ